MNHLKCNRLKMPKNKMITKGCPHCDMQVPVACKACPCGHTFFSARRTIRPTGKMSPTSDLETTRRRTERVKREKPNYYDALEYDNQMKKKLLPRQKSGASSAEERDEGREFVDMEDDDEIDLKNGSRKRRLRRKFTTEREEEEEDPMANLPPEKAFQYSIELAEINRKIISASWKPQES